MLPNALHLVVPIVKKAFTKAFFIVTRSNLKSTISSIENAENAETQLFSKLTKY